MRIKKYRYFVSDFETTVYSGQVHTEVWASANVELFTEKVNIFKSIKETFDFYVSLKSNVIVYYHNLKFDGSFWLPFLMCDLKLKQALEEIDENNVEWVQDKYMKNNTFKYSISDMGQWYTIIIKVNGYYIEIRDSLKLLPFSVKRIGKSFGTKHKKLDMEYKGFRYSGCEITEEEKRYIENDVLVVKEALEIMFQQDHTKLTIGSCCLEEFKRLTGKEDYEMYFPDLTQIEIDKENYGSSNADEYIRKSYRGGWCYLVKGKEKQIKRNGVTFDVNSLYPSMMSSESGNYYPTGKPYFWSGNIIPDKAIGKNKYYFIRIKTRFYIRENMLPFIQIKNSFLYKGNECLETTDIYNDKTGEYNRFYKKDNATHDSKVILTLTMTDFELLKKHYELVDFEILDGCWFYSEIGLFDAYIEKYKKIKIESDGAIRELAKLFLNNLYGKMASSTNSSFKIAYDKGNGILGFKSIHAEEKQAGYIAVGSAITSFARNFTINGAQANYYGVNKNGFCYADTDSIHCDITEDKIKGITVHDTAFCNWKHESKWDIAIFTRQKTYIEHVTHESKKGQVVEVEPFYNIKCAGMPDKCKNLFEMSLNPPDEQELEKYSIEEREFILSKKELTDFTIGLTVTGKLMPKRISGGIVLVDTTYKMR